MRKFLRKWLGIKEVQKIPSNFEIAEEVIRAPFFMEDVIDRVMYRLIHRKERSAVDFAHEEIKRIVESEKFIDDIVERIRKKQL